MMLYLQSESSYKNKNNWQYFCCPRPHLHMSTHSLLSLTNEVDFSQASENLERGANPEREDCQ